METDVKDSYLQRLQADALTEKDAFSAACLHYQVVSFLLEVGGEDKEVYNHLKAFSINLLESLDSRGYSYDEFPVDKIDAVAQRSSPELAFKIYSCVERLLVRYGYVSCYHWAEVRKGEQALLVSKEESLSLYYVRAWSKQFLLSCFGSWRRVVVSALAFYLVVAVVLMESPFGFYLFEFHQVSFCEKEVFNHFVNVISLLFSLHKDVFISPTGILGIIILSMVKLFIATFVVNIIAYFVTGYAQEVRNDF
nr:hypothetical protein [Pseudodesulfovibrio sp.]